MLVLLREVECTLLLPFYRGAKVTVIGAISFKKVVALMTLDGSMDGGAFKVFIEKFLVPQLWSGAVVVMDNLPAHKLASILPLIRAVGADVLNLSPYSPDFNPPIALVVATQHKTILCVQSASRSLPEDFELLLEELCEAARRNNDNSIVFLLKHLVPEYTHGKLKAGLKPETLEYTHPELQGSEHKQSFSEVVDTDIGTYARSLTPLHLGNNVRQALKSQAFRIHYQPIVFLPSDIIMGFEALVRWQHPQRGLVSPAEFMPVVEETNLIIPLGWWVLRSACRQMRVWQEQFPAQAPLIISVNLSGRQFFQPDLIQQIKQVLQETGLDARTLRLEIAESIVMENPESAATTLLQLKALGVQLEVDQLGIGYAFLNRLQRLPNLMCYEKFDRLKIDRSLISQIEIDEESLEIVHKIVANANDLGMDITAAGIETAGQLALLRALKCEYGQGYLFSKPLEGEAAKKLIGAQMQLS